MENNKKLPLLDISLNEANQILKNFEEKSLNFITHEAVWHIFDSYRLNLINNSPVIVESIHHFCGCISFLDGAYKLGLKLDKDERYQYPSRLAEHLNTRTNDIRHIQDLENVDSANLDEYVSFIKEVIGSVLEGYPGKNSLPLVSWILFYLKPRSFPIWNDKTRKQLGLKKVQNQKGHDKYIVKAADEYGNLMKKYHPIIGYLKHHEHEIYTENLAFLKETNFHPLMKIVDKLLWIMEKEKD